MSEEPTPLARWLERLPPSEREVVERALRRDPDLPEQLEVILDGWPDHVRDAFLQGFQSAVVDAELPAAAVMDGLRAAAAAGSDIRPSSDARKRSGSQNG